MDRELEKRFVFLNFGLEPISILSYIARHQSLPRIVHAVVRDDRFLGLYFHRAGRSGEKVWEPLLSTSELDQRMTMLHGMIAKIRGRGGDVVLYRSPVSDGVLEDEQSRYPVETWLPRVATMLDVKVIDFATIPALRALAPPDGEHLEAADAPLATLAVAQALVPLLAPSSTDRVRAISHPAGRVFSACTYQRTVSAMPSAVKCVGW